MAGRPKSFDEDRAMDAFVDVFWSKGYDATSVDDLQAAAGIKRGSFYAAFGSKDEVFQAVLERYWTKVTEPGFIRLAPGKSPLDGLADFVRYVGTFMSENTARGCLLLSSAAMKVESKTNLQAVTDRMSLLEQRLKEYMKTDTGLVSAAPERIDAISAYVMTVLMGLNALARTHHTGKSIRLAADVAADSLTALPSTLKQDMP